MTLMFSFLLLDDVLCNVRPQVGFETLNRRVRKASDAMCGVIGNIMKDHLEERSLVSDLHGITMERQDWMIFPTPQTCPTCASSVHLGIEARLRPTYVALGTWPWHAIGDEHARACMVPLVWKNDLMVADIFILSLRPTSSLPLAERNLV